MPGPCASAAPLGRADDTFSALALLFAALGVYAMSPAWRSPRAGVRDPMALGSRLRRSRACCGRAGWMAAGLVAGGLGILAVIRLLGALVPGLSGSDPLALGGAFLVLLTAAAVALLIPARRAARVDPVAALRVD
jgi:putative ABC transport system permease protein